MKKRKDLLPVSDMNGRQLRDGDLVKRWWGTEFLSTGTMEVYRHHRVEAVRDKWGHVIGASLSGCSNHIDHVQYVARLPKGIKLHDEVTNNNALASRKRMECPRYAAFIDGAARRFMEAIKDDPIIKALREASHG